MKRLAAICTLILSGCSVGSSDVPSMPDWSMALHASEPVGFDGIHCWKMPVSDEDWQKTVAELQLASIDRYPSFDSEAANCKATWWDIDFPKEAQRYWRSSDGGIRRLAAYRAGVMYVIHELR